MNDIAKRLSNYIKAHPFDSGNSNCETVLDLLYQAYIESHDTDPPEISNGFKELEQFLRTLPLADNDAVFNLCCRLCIAYEHKAFMDGFRYGMQLSREI